MELSGLWIFYVIRNNPHLVFVQFRREIPLCVKENFSLTGGHFFFTSLIYWYQQDKKSFLLKFCAESAPFFLVNLRKRLCLLVFQKILRRDRDSNPGGPFGAYTLSRRAPSTTRPPLQNGNEGAKIRKKYELRMTKSKKNRIFARPNVAYLETPVTHIHFPLPLFCRNGAVLHRVEPHLWTKTCAV